VIDIPPGARWDTCDREGNVMPGSREVTDRNTKESETFAELVERINARGEGGRHRRTTRQPASAQPSGTTLATLDTVPLSRTPRRMSRLRAGQAILVSTGAVALTLIMIFETGSDSTGRKTAPQTQRVSPTSTVPASAPAVPPPPLTVAPPPAAVAPPALEPAPVATPRQSPTTEAAPPRRLTTQTRRADPLTTLFCRHNRDELTKRLGIPDDHQRCDKRDDRDED
jgi:hypothetical protein